MTTRKLFLSVVTVAFCSILAIGQEKRVQISGRVIDNHGRGLQDAVVLADYEACKDCFEHIVPTFKTIEDGFFVIEFPFADTREVTLFVEGPIPHNAWVPYTPTLWLASRSKNHLGKTIRL